MTAPEPYDLTHILRTGEPRRLKYPEREDVEVVELSQEEWDEIILNRAYKSTVDGSG